jgi:hypothetical protein
MQRRTFLQGAAASIVAARFGAAFAQGQNPPQGNAPREPTIIYNEHSDELRERKINPLDAPPEVLSEFGLPQAPSQYSPIYPLWREMFSRPLLYLFAETIAMETAYQTNPRFQQVQAAAASRYETSPNWSGAYVHPRAGNMLVDVVGSWRIPGIAMPGGLSGVLPPACSIWVGLDGQRRYFDSSLPQIGTRQQFDSSGNPQYIGWYQWWVRDQPPPAAIPQVPISLTQGDMVLCLVQASAPSEAIVAMLKFGSVFEFWSRKIQPLVVTGPLPVISGATAEWVVERPTLLGSDKLHLLPRFDPVEFTNCYADEALAINSPDTVIESLHGARFIQLFEKLDDPERISMLSKPRHLLSDDQYAFRVNFIG